MAALNGKFKLTTSENFEEYMKEIGVPDQLIKVGADTNAETAIAQDGDCYTLTLSAAGRSSVQKFKLGEEFEETTPHGVKVNTTITRNGNKLVQVQKGSVESTITREFNDDELIVTLQAGSITSIRKYKKYE